ncbi:MAG TPA: ParB/RepB/Spo0J family partition protein [Anaerolineae bacterium]|nr:ParB/RepB/Spo0J family partition protein [Anaerolineae bacterium]
MKIKLSDIKPSPGALRKTWSEEGLEELAQSIKEHGLIVPIKVRPINGKYELVYGHRRVKAMRRAGVEETEAIVEGVDDTEVIIQALIENVQREEMNPIDIAKALFQIQELTGWSQTEMAQRGIMGRKSIQQHMALLQESPTIQQMISRGYSGKTPPEKITEKHVRVVRQSGLQAPIREDILRKAAKEGLTSDQSRKVAESIKAARSEERAKFLLGTPFSDLQHDPELEKERPARPVGGDRPSTIDWHLYPDAGRILDKLSRWEKEDIPKMRASDELNKLAPEAGRFIARRIKRIENALAAWREELEERHGTA